MIKKTKTAKILLNTKSLKTSSEQIKPEWSEGDKSKWPRLAMTCHSKSESGLWESTKGESKMPQKTRGAIFINLPEAPVLLFQRVLEVFSPQVSNLIPYHRHTCYKSMSLQSLPSIVNCFLLPLHMVT